MPCCPSKSGKAGRETSRDWGRVAENLGNRGIGKSEGDNESYRSVKEGLTEIKATQRDRQRHFEPAPVRDGASTEVFQGVPHDVVKGCKCRMNQVRGTGTESEGNCREDCQRAFSIWASWRSLKLTRVS